MDWFTPVPSTPADREDALGKAIVYGFGFNYTGTPPLPDFNAVLLQHLINAYREGIANGEIGLKWKMSVAQAFIIGQLARYFWQKKGGALKFRHLASAWAVFGMATSSCACAQWVVGPPSGSKNAYVLPQIPAVSGEVATQIDEPCALCN